jgi:hypothetical protein
LIKFPSHEAALQAPKDQIHVDVDGNVLT